MGMGAGEKKVEEEKVRREKRKADLDGEGVEGVDNDADGATAAKEAPGSAKKRKGAKGMQGAEGDEGQAPPPPKGKAGTKGPGADTDDEDDDDNAEGGAGAAGTAAPSGKVAKPAPGAMPMSKSAAVGPTSAAAALSGAAKALVPPKPPTEGEEPSGGVKTVPPKKRPKARETGPGAQGAEGWVPPPEGSGIPLGKDGNVAGRFTKEEDARLLAALENALEGRKGEVKSIEDARAALRGERTENSMPDRATWKGWVRWVWDEVVQACPGRSRESVYSRGRRLLQDTKRGAWTETEIHTIKRMAEESKKSNGQTQWVEIGKELNRPASACRDIYRHKMQHLSMQQVSVAAPVVQAVGVPPPPPPGAPSAPAGTAAGAIAGTPVPGTKGTASAAVGALAAAAAAVTTTATSAVAALSGGIKGSDAATATAAATLVQAKENPPSSRWGAEESRQLEDAVRDLQKASGADSERKSDRISWQTVALKMHGRTPDQCRLRWRVMGSGIDMDSGKGGKKVWEKERRVWDENDDQALMAQVLKQVDARGLTQPRDISWSSVKVPDRLPHHAKERFRRLHQDIKTKLKLTDSELRRAVIELQRPRSASGAAAAAATSSYMPVGANGVAGGPPPPPANPTAAEVLSTGAKRAFETAPAGSAAVKPPVGAKAVAVGAAAVPPAPPAVTASAVPVAAPGATAVLAAAAGASLAGKVGAVALDAEDTDPMGRKKKKPKRGKDGEQV